MQKNIELLYFEDCPSWKNTLDVLNAVIDENELDVEIDLLKVETQEEAELYHFVGSPTIRIDGKDIFPTGQDQYALGCRVYSTPEGFKGWPTKDMLKEKLENITLEE